MMVDNMTLLLAITTLFFFFNDTATTEIYTLSLHDALPISNTLIGSSGDTLIGGSGFDVLIASGDNNTVIGGSGTSRLYASGTGNTLQGGSGTKLIYRSALNKRLVGGRVLSMAFYNNGAAIDLGAGTAVVAGGGTDRLIGITDVLVNGDHSTLTGGAGSFQLYVSRRDLPFCAARRSSELLSSTLNNALIGGSGQTVVSYGNHAVVDLGAGTAVVAGGGTDRLIGITHVVVTGSNNILTTTSVANATLEASGGSGNLLIGASAQALLKSTARTNTPIGSSRHTLVG